MRGLRIVGLWRLRDRLQRLDHLRALGVVAKHVQRLSGLIRRHSMRGRLIRLSRDLRIHRISEQDNRECKDRECTRELDHAEGNSEFEEMGTLIVCKKGGVSVAQWPHSAHRFRISPAFARDHALSWRISLPIARNSSLGAARACASTAW